MQNTPELIFAGKLLAIVMVVMFCLSAFPSLANAQGGQGQNAVYLSGTCCVGSSSFIDASMFASSQHPNICAVLNFILSSTTYPGNGTVVDARGLNINNTSMACTTANPSPWAGIAHAPPSTILLPAGTIVIPGAWILPNKTILIGEGEGITPGTTIQAQLSFTDSGPARVST
jgi:hypothetical protein